MARKDSEHQKQSMSRLFRDKAIFKTLTKKYTDSDALYDGYVEDDDTEEKARSARLTKKEARR